MKTKYLVAAAVIGTALLATSTPRDKTSELEGQLGLSSTTKNESPAPYSPESDDPNSYDPNQDMKAIIEPRDELYFDKNKVAF